MRRPVVGGGVVERVSPLILVREKMASISADTKIKGLTPFTTNMPRSATRPLPPAPSPLPTPGASAPSTGKWGQPVKLRIGDWRKENEEGRQVRSKIHRLTPFLEWTDEKRQYISVQAEGCECRCVGNKVMLWYCKDVGDPKKYLLSGGWKKWRANGQYHDPR